MSDLTVQWRKARACHANNTCVEVAGLGGTVGARDGKLGPASHVLRFSRPEWSAFVGRARAGDFDLPGSRRR